MKDLLASSVDTYVMILIILCGIVGYYVIKILNKEDLDETTSTDNPYYRGLEYEEEYTSDDDDYYNRPIYTLKEAKPKSKRIKKPINKNNS